MGHHYDDKDYDVKKEEAARKSYDNKTDWSVSARMNRLRNYLKDRAPAIEGQDGDNHTNITIRAALDYDLDDGVTLTLLMQEWNPRCQPPWDEPALLDKIKRIRGFMTPQARPDITRKIAEALAGNTKPTNPKDAIGIRKPRCYSAMSAHVDRLVGIGMLEGAAKYGRHNYRPAAVRASVYYDATREHLGSFWEGEDVDPDSKLPHVIKAICSLYVLADAIVTGNLVDDRPPRTAGVREMINAYQPIVDKIFDTYKEPKAAFTHLNSTVKTIPVSANPWLFEQPVKTSEEK